MSNKNERVVHVDPKNMHLMTAEDKAIMKGSVNTFAGPWMDELLGRTKDGINPKADISSETL